MKIGDIVYLKSGSPPLTVSMLDQPNIVNVDWFAGDDMRRDAFHPDQLTAEKPVRAKDIFEMNWSTDRAA